MRLKSVTFLLCALSLTVLASESKKDNDQALKLGEPIPKTDVEMKNVDGRMLSIRDVIGENGTLIIFSCNHCPFVKAWQERIVKIGNKYREKGIGVILINSNDPDEYAVDDLEHMKKLAKREGYKFPYVVDETSNIARAFNANRTPEVFLFDEENKLVYHGAIDDNPHKPKKVEEHYLINALDALLAGEEIEKQKTRSVGCSIKFR